MEKKKKFKNTVFLILILFLAFFLRFYKLNQVPPSLYWEEVALGYDAFSLLKTGRDHRGNPWPIAYLESYRDYKPPLYVYTVVPSVWLFGLNEFSVRLPSAFFGTLTVLVVYFLTKELLKSSFPLRSDIFFYSVFKSRAKKFNLSINSSTRRCKHKNTHKKNILPAENIALTTVFLLAISPWHLQFSRAAFEANLALFLIVMAVLLFLMSLKKGIFLPLSAIFFTLSLYAYHGARIFAPLILLFLVIVFYKRLWRIKLFIAFSIIIGLILLFPLIKSLAVKEVRQRFQETSAFATLEPILESNRKIQEDGGGRIAKLIHHRFWEYGRIFLDKYFQHFHGTYLFLSGDSNPRHSTQEFGIVYHWELFTLILGIIILLRNPKRENLFILGWLLITPVPASFTKATPHALRTIFGLPAYSIISAIGLVQLIKVLKNRRILLFTVYCLLFTEFVLYLHFYYYHYPKIYSFYWQYGYKQAINFIKEHQDKYEAVYLTNERGRAYMYYLFYTQMDPFIAQELIRPFRKLPDIPRIGKVFIGKKPSGEKKILWAGVPKETIEGKILKEINFLNDQKAFVIWEN